MDLKEHKTRVQAEADEAPWEGECELPAGVEIREDEGTTHMLDGMGSIKEMMGRLTEAVAENDSTHGEMIAMAHTEAELAKVMMQMYESIRAWR